MEETSKIFERLGLTGYESAVLAALFQAQDVTASDISKASEVPYTKIYSILNSLEKQGFVKMSLERPKRYFPEKPTLIIKRLLRKKEKTVQVMYKVAETNVSLLNKLYKDSKAINQEIETVLVRAV